MKYLSYIIALWVLLLSTVPCFLKDECLFQCKNDTQEETTDVPAQIVAAHLSCIATPVQAALRPNCFIRHLSQ